MSSRLLVVGGSADIARCFATRWLAEDSGRTALLQVCSSAARLAPLMGQFASRIDIVEQDLSMPAGVQNFISALRGEISAIDRILFCAGLPFRYEKAAKFDWDYFERDSNIQLRTLAELCSLLLQNHAQGAARVRIALMLSSVVLGVPPKYTTMYTTLKYAILGYMKAIGSEAPQRMQINALAPGMVDTRFVAALPGSVRELIARTQQPDRLISTEEVAGVISFLLEQAPPQMNGVVLPVGFFI